MIDLIGGFCVATLALLFVTACVGIWVSVGYILWTEVIQPTTSRLRRKK